MEDWSLKMEPWNFYSPVVADSHHYNEEQDPRVGIKKPTQKNPKNPPKKTH
jgi:hypothetical protein